MSPILEHRPRVLVVDPVPETAGVIELILKRSGECEVARCDTPHQALKLTRAGKVDLVLMDAFFPEDASLKFCRSLRGDPDLEHFPVILFSSEHNRSEMLRGFEAGAVDYLFKPLFPTELAARVRTHFQLKRQKDLTLRKVVEQRELLQLMCHDITGPVGSVKMVLEMCEHDPDAFETARKMVVDSLDRVLELTDLVRQMRAFEDGKMDFRLESWPVEALLEQALQVVSTRIEKKGLTIRKNIRSGLMVKVEAVSFVNSVMANLMTNAVKFSYSGESIEIGAVTENERIFIMVEDRGIGMSEKLQSRLFDPKQMTSRPGTESEPGTGYGMLLVKKFVEGYGGRVIIESRDIETHPKNSGTRIILDLPMG